MMRALMEERRAKAMRPEKTASSYRSEDPLRRQASDGDITRHLLGGNGENKEHIQAQVKKKDDPGTQKEGPG